MPHSHGHCVPEYDTSNALPEFVGRRVTVAIRSAVLVAAAMTILGLIVLWPNGSAGRASDTTFFVDAPIKATVTNVTTGPCTGTTEADRIPCNEISLHLDGQPVPTPVVPRGGGPATTPAGPTMEQGISDVGGLRPGDDIYVTMAVLGDGSASFSFYDYQRATPMWVLAIAFLVAVLVLGRWRPAASSVHPGRPGGRIARWERNHCYRDHPSACRFHRSRISGSHHDVARSNGTRPKLRQPPRAPAGRLRIALRIECASRAAQPRQSAATKRARW